MDEKLNKPMKKYNSKKKAKTKHCRNYYYFLFTSLIAIEILLIINSSKKYNEEKNIFKIKHELIVNKDNNISKIISEIETLEQEIKDIETNIIPKSNIELNLFQNELNNLLSKNKNISEIYQDSFEEYKTKKEIFEDEIIEKNNTIKGLYDELNNKVIIRTKLEYNLDIIEDKLSGEVSDIKIKSTIIENENHKNLLLKWIAATSGEKIKKFKLIFSAEEHDFESFSFHEICGDENIDNTLIIIKTENNDIIGGFTFASWTANSLISYDDKAFVFNLNDELKLRISNPSFAINSRINDGPIFGIYDLIINSNKLKIQEKMESYGDKDLGIGNNIINIVNYEVFTVIFE